MGGRGFYQILEEAPGGCQNNLFFCRSLEDNKRYVLEFAPQNLAHVELQKYLRRALFLMVLEHEKGVITARDFSMDPMRSFVVLDWVPGKTLEAVFKYSKFNVKEALWILLDLTKTLEHLVDFSFVHRNINPGIIVLHENTGRVYLGGMDYLTQSDFMQTRLDLNVQYVSPEMMRSLLRPEDLVFLTPFTDIYSIGAVFYHMVTGEPPFAKRTNMEKWANRSWVPKIRTTTLTRKEKRFCQYLLKKTMCHNFIKRWSVHQLRDYIMSYLKDSKRNEDLKRWIKQEKRYGSQGIKL